jgi:tRNA U34 5-methylaminomethyl-2-thiouridine-forming methyltransferase MnmC
MPNPDPSAVPVPPVSAEAGDYSLVRLRNGAHSVRARRYGETMHPGVGPMAEAESLYVRQTGLLDRLRAAGGEFVIWDVGLGAGANALTVLRAIEAWPVRVRLLSFDNTLEPLRFALAHPTQLPYVAGREGLVAELLRAQRVRWSNGQSAVEWETWIDDFPRLLQGEAARSWPKPDLILYDPFSPARNPGMWTLGLFEHLFRLLDPARPCAMPTYSRSTLLRVTLLVAGFWVGAGHATGRKEETTVAANHPSLVAHPLNFRWLERARRSDSAEPLHHPAYTRSPLTPETLARLQSHPQFTHHSTQLITHN